MSVYIHIHTYVYVYMYIWIHSTYEQHLRPQAGARVRNMRVFVLSHTKTNDGIRVGIERALLDLASGITAMHAAHGLQRAVCQESCRRNELHACPGICIIFQHILGSECQAFGDEFFHQHPLFVVQKVQADHVLDGQRVFLGKLVLEKSSVALDEYRHDIGGSR